MWYLHCNGCTPAPESLPEAELLIQSASETLICLQPTQQLQRFFKACDYDMTDLVAARLEQMAQSVFPLVPSSEHALQALQAAMNNERRQQVRLLQLLYRASLSYWVSDMLLLLLLLLLLMFSRTGMDLSLAAPSENVLPL